MVDATSATSVFTTDAEWLAQLSGPDRYLAIGALLSEGKKAYYPTEIQNDTDRQDLIAAHLAGSLRPRLCLNKSASFMVEKPFALGRFTPLRTGTGFLATSITWDIDGPGHANGLTPEQVDAQTWAIADIAEEAGLMPSVVRSNSGAGRHVIVTIADPIEAGLAVFIANGVVALVPGAEKMEVFPRTATLRDGQFGRVIALPLNGAAPAPGGGRIIDRVGTELTVASVRMASQDAIAAFLPAYERHGAAEARIREARQAQGAMFADLAHSSGREESWSQATLEQVVRTFADIADDRETEAHIIGIRCPTHGGTCLHVNPEVGWYYCHKCGHKGAGPGAPFMLLRLLRPDWTTGQIRTELAALHAKSAENSGAPS